jgi:predicted aspartyl protease
MIQGSVVELQARVDVRFRLPARPDFSIECVVDTGFEGALTLPPAAIAALAACRRDFVSPLS